MSEGWVQTVAIITPAVVAVLVTWMAARGQYRLAANERKQARLDDAYRSVAAYAVRVRQYATVAHAGMSDDYALLPPPLGEGDLWATHSLVELHGTERVRSAYDDLLTAYARLRTAVADFGDAKEMPPRGDPAIVQWRRDAQDSFREERDRTLQAVGALLEALRADLDDRERAGR